MARKLPESSAPRLAGEPDRSWNVRDAKAQLSKVVSGALEHPQRIARRDGASVVVLNEEAYRTLLERAERQLDLVDYFRDHAIGGPALERPRPRTRRAVHELD